MFIKNSTIGALRRATIVGAFAVVATLTIGIGAAQAQYYSPYQYGYGSPYYSHYPYGNEYQARHAWWHWRHQYWRWYHENYR